MHYLADYIGKKVVIPSGYGYDKSEPMRFIRAEKDLPGTLLGFRKGRVYIELESGEIVITGDQVLIKN